jgi:hypothetical protein
MRQLNGLAHINRSKGLTHTKEEISSENLISVMFSEDPQNYF